MAERTPGRLGAVRDALGATVGAVLGAAPHVLHHIAPIVGSALISGVGGNLLFYALGLLLSVPMLRRIHRRFGSWVAPAVALAVFTSLFLFSALVVGPAISSDPARGPAPGPTGVPAEQHSTHHT